MNLTPRFNNILNHFRQPVVPLGRPGSSTDNSIPSDTLNGVEQVVIKHSLCLGCFLFKETLV